MSTDNKINNDASDNSVKSKESNWDDWGENVYRVGNELDPNADSHDGKNDVDNKENGGEDKFEKRRKHIESWLASVFQSEHFSLLLGNGFTNAVAQKANKKTPDMACDFEGFPLKGKLEAAAEASAIAMGRGKANIEDQIRAANALARGLDILGDDIITEIKDEDLISGADLIDGVDITLNKMLGKFLRRISNTEKELKIAIEKCAKKINQSEPTDKDAESLDTLTMLVSFLLSFASRTATRERLHIFTTNYDRLIEHGADLAGLHLLDRFVGYLEPIFRSSRLDIDMHYNPPGIRGEPRYLEGVARLTKLHGSLDWVCKNGFVRKIGLPFGPDERQLSPHGHPDAGGGKPTAHASSGTSGAQPNNTSGSACDEFTSGVPVNSVMIYPNSAKDRETSEYPYVELFRDFAAAICRPNSALVTYGYGFGDDHINRTIADMLTIPSTHLVIISYCGVNGRIHSFCKKVGRDAQITLLIGPHFGDMATLVKYYLPKPAIDRISIRQTELLRKRGWEPSSQNNPNPQLEE